MANPTFECPNMDDHLEVLNEQQITQIAEQWKQGNPPSEDEMVYFVVDEMVKKFSDEIKKI